MKISLKQRIISGFTAASILSSVFSSLAFADNIPSVETSAPAYSETTETSVPGTSPADTSVSAGEGTTVGDVSTDTSYDTAADTSATSESMTEPGTPAPGTSDTSETQAPEGDTTETDTEATGSETDIYTGTVDDSDTAEDPFAVYPDETILSGDRPYRFESGDMTADATAFAGAVYTCADEPVNANDVTYTVDEINAYDTIYSLFDIRHGENAHCYRSRFTCENGEVKVSDFEQDITVWLSVPVPEEMGYTVKAFCLDENGISVVPYETVTENGFIQAVVFTTRAQGFAVVENIARSALTASADGEYNITVTYDKTALIPEGAELKVTEIHPDAYIEETAAALGWSDEDYICYTRFYDIAIMKDGAETEPASAVIVNAQLLDVEQGAEALQVVHFDTDGAEEIATNASDDAVVSANETAVAVTFETEAFSVYGFGSALHTIMTESGEFAEISVYSAADGVVSAEAVPAMPPEEGLTTEQAFAIAGTESLDGRAWIGVKPAEGTELPEGESIALYNVKNDCAADVLIEDITAAGGLLPVDDISAVAVVRDTGYRHLTITAVPDEATVISIDGMMPKGASAAASDVTAQYARAAGPLTIEQAEEEALEDKTLAAFDIAIMNGEDKYQPGGERPVSVTITDPRIDGENIELWHIPDEGEPEQITDFTLEKGRISFAAHGFSVYKIVKGRNPYVLRSFFDQLALDGPGGMDVCLYVGSSSPNKTGTKYYFTSNLVHQVTGNNDRDGIMSTTTAPGEKLYFIRASDNENNKNLFYIYLLINGEPKYLKTTDVTSGTNTGTRGGLTLVDENDKGVFTLSNIVDGCFIASSTGNSGRTYYLNRNTKTPELGAICGYNAATDNNTIWFSIDVNTTIPDDYYELDGKTYCIAYYKEGVEGAGMNSEIKLFGENGRFEGTRLLIRPDVLENSGDLLIAKDTELAEWTFTCVEGNIYNISTQIGGETRYITFNGASLSLGTDPDAAGAKIAVETGTGENEDKYRFSVGGRTLALVAGKAENGFAASNSGDDKAWLNLVEPTTILTQEDFKIYSAEKVDISDRNKVPDKADLVIYVRKWNDETKKYEYYVINHDGSLLRCYESGDMIQWVGTEVNTAEWHFTEYHFEGTDTPNYYYELQNNYSGKYISPEMSPESGSSQILSDTPPGINLPGRKNGYYYSKIQAWCDDHYRYAALKTDDNGLTSCDIDHADDFYFAIIRPTETDEHTTVKTLDNNEYGITMKMYDLPNREFMSNLLGNDAYKQYTGVKGLLSSSLTNGYPTITAVTANGKSLSEIYGDNQPTEVNYLFIENIYTTSGYFSYDSSQNFASFYDENGVLHPDRFTVYKELGTTDAGNTVTLKHGIFLPYNHLSGTQSSNNPYNLYAVDGTELPDSDPRKEEKLYKVAGDTDYFFIAELGASFTQTADGKDNWGHDIIYEFTGDDDFWLYVDGELLIDLGGVHSALSGNVNFSTGTVQIDGYDTVPKFKNGTPIGTLDGKILTTTIYNVFKYNYEQRGMTDSEVEEALAEKFESDTKIFKDYTSHDMKIFYMERGAGSSNLKMRFNLSSVKPGTVLLSKELEGVEEKDNYMTEFPYQIFFRRSSTELVEEPLVRNAEIGGKKIKVVYKDTSRDVTFLPTYTAPNGMVYNNVFLLKPGEVAEFTMPDETMEYRVVECCVDSDLYGQVTVNGVDAVEKNITGHEAESEKDYEAAPASIAERPTVEYVNHLDPDRLETLRIKKELYEVDGTTKIENSDTEFSFRLYLGAEHDASITEAYMHKYHVKDPQGNYCYWDANAKKFVSLQKTDYTTLTAEEKVRATFATSIYGSISRIPPEYTVEIRELLSGTKFKVEERYNEIPDGYSLKQYVVTEDGQAAINDTDGVPDAYTIHDNGYEVVVQNIKGWGLRMNKKWTDVDFMEARDPVYFAVYRNRSGTLKLLDGSGAGITDDTDLHYDPANTVNTVRRLDYGSDSLYWYFEKIEQGLSFNDYVVREVNLTGDFTVDANGYVTGYSTITPIDGGDTNTVNGQQIGGSSMDYDYTVTYDQGTLQANSNIRVATVTNSRPGVKLVKYDKSAPPKPLPGAVFTLKNEAGDNIAAETYTSDDDGLITTAYLPKDEWCVLTEIAAPTGYQAVSNDFTAFHATVEPIRIKLTNDDQVIVEGGDYSSYYEIEAPTAADGDAIKVIKLYNKKYTLNVKKLDGNATPYPIENHPENLPEVPIANAHFALYKEVYGGSSGWRMDYMPLAGFEDMVSGADGVLSDITDAFSTGQLRAGSYYLVETEPLANYQPLSSAVLFTVTKTGAVVAGSPNQDGVPNPDPNKIDPGLYSNPKGLEIIAYDGENVSEMHYDLLIRNYAAQERKITVEKQVISDYPTDITDGNGVSEAKFDFTATLYMPDGRTRWDYDDNGFSNGKTTFRLADDGTEVLTVPEGAVLSVRERSDPWYDTKNQWLPDGETARAVENTDTCTVTVPEGNGTMLFTNTRKKVNVTVKKALSDPLTNEGTFRFGAVVKDYGVDITSSIAAVGGQTPDDFTLTVNNNQPTIKFTIPLGATFNVVETLQTGQEIYVVSGDKNDEEHKSPITSNKEIKVTNKRKTHTVTVTKTLIDPDTTVTTKEFTFTVTVYKKDGTNLIPLKDVVLYKNGNNDVKTDADGKHTFKLNPTNGGAAVIRELTIPYDAVLKVSEDPIPYVATIVQTVGENTPITIQNKDTTIDTVTADTTVAYTNKPPTGDNVDLTVKKEVSGNLGDKSHDFTFTLTVAGAANGETFSWTKNGVAQTAIASGGTFEIRHDDVAVFTVPTGRQVTVTEDSEGYSTTFKRKTGENTYEDITFPLTLNSPEEVKVTNTLGGIIPTDVKLPQVSAVLTGLIALGAAFLTRPKRLRPEDRDDDDE